MNSKRPGRSSTTLKISSLSPEIWTTLMAEEIRHVALALDVKTKAAGISTHLRQPAPSLMPIRPTDGFLSRE